MGDLKIAVYDLKQAERFNGKFDKKIFSTIDTKKVFIEYAENHNKTFDKTGSFYDINKSENEKFIKLANEKLEKMKKGKK